MTYLNRIAGSVVALAAVSAAIGSGCYDNVGSLCHLWWQDIDPRCPDTVLPDASDPVPIDVMTHAQEGFDDFGSDSCDAWVIVSLWMTTSEDCLDMTPAQWPVQYYTAFGGECP